MSRPTEKSSLPLGMQSHNVGWIQSICFVILLMVSLASMGYSSGSPAHDLCEAGTVVNWSVSQDYGRYAIELIAKDDNKRFLYVTDVRASANAAPLKIDNASNASWCPQGDKLAYDVVTDNIIYPSLNIHEERIAIYDFRNRASKFVTSGYLDAAPVWNPHSDSLAVTRCTFPPSAIGCQIVLWKERNQICKQVGSTYSRITGLAWDPGETRLAYIGTNIRPDQNDGHIISKSNIYMLDTASGKTTALTRTGNISQSRIQWSPDGLYIAYLSTERTRTSGDQRLTSVKVVNVASKKTTAVLSEDADKMMIDTPLWSPSGSCILIGESLCKNGSTSAVVIGWPDYKNKLVKCLDSGILPKWSKDGTEILFLQGSEVWAVEANKDCIPHKYSVWCNGK